MTDSAANDPPGGLGIRARSVRRKFDNGVVALDGLDMDVAPGEFVAIVGPSGCGKSSLLRLIAKLDRTQGGMIALEEATSPILSGDRRRTAFIDRTSLAFVFQDAQLLPWRTVLGNAMVPLELMRVPRTARCEAASRAVEQVGLSDAANRYPNQLSGGMRMRVSLARAMVTRPRLLLMDEPFAALDEITRQRLDEQLRELWQERKMTVVFVTHSIAEAVFLSNRVVVMSRRPGRFILDRQIALPVERRSSLRSTAEFAEQTRDLFEALRDEAADAPAGAPQ